MVLLFKTFNYTMSPDHDCRRNLFSLSHDNLVSFLAFLDVIKILDVNSLVGNINEESFSFSLNGKWIDEGGGVFL